MQAVVHGLKFLEQPWYPIATHMNKKTVQTVHCGDFIIAVTWWQLFEHRLVNWYCRMTKQIIFSIIEQCNTQLSQPNSAQPNVTRYLWLVFLLQSIFSWQTEQKHWHILCSVHLKLKVMTNLRIRDTIPK